MLCNHVSKALPQIFYHHCFSLRVMGFSYEQWLDGAWIMQNKWLIPAIRMEIFKGLTPQSHRVYSQTMWHELPQLGKGILCLSFSSALAELPGPKPLGLLGSGCSQKGTSHSLTADLPLTPWQSWGWTVLSHLWLSTLTISSSKIRLNMFCLHFKQQTYYYIVLPLLHLQPPHRIEHKEKVSC